MPRDRRAMTWRPFSRTSWKPCLKTSAGNPCLNMSRRTRLTKLCAPNETAGTSTTAAPRLCSTSPMRWSTSTTPLKGSSPRSTSRKSPFPSHSAPSAALGQASRPSGRASLLSSMAAEERRGRCSVQVVRGCALAGAANVGLFEPHQSGRPALVTGSWQLAAAGRVTGSWQLAAAGQDIRAAGSLADAPGNDVAFF